MQDTTTSDDGGSGTAHATVRVWEGHKRTGYDTLLDTEPDEYEMPIVPADTYYVPHDEHTVLADRIETHRRYAFHVETPEPVVLYVETNDSHHAPVDGFTDGPAVERGLRYVPETDNRHTDEPFKVELWGRIRMRVEADA